jgi:uncharacterized protein YijF (DUF1287 family)
MIVDTQPDSSRAVSRRLFSESSLIPARTSCRRLRTTEMRTRWMIWRILLPILVLAPIFGAEGSEFAKSLVAAARERTTKNEIYDGSYRVIAYPMGDVPDDRGACTDVVIRAYRKVNVDLQALVHQDMRRNFPAYPQLWGLRGPDRNIDHRRVPNLQKFFQRAGASLPISPAPEHYKPGDLVTWVLPRGLPHIGIVSDTLVRGAARPMILHNIGAGTKEEDVLFAYPITGHYRYEK